MSDASIVNVMERIRAAHPNSPIHVFKTIKPDCLDARFGATVHGQYSCDDPLFLGSFHAHMGDAILAEAEARLITEIRPK
jgi:hypothetical protein